MMQSHVQQLLNKNNDLGSNVWFSVLIVLSGLGFFFIVCKELGLNFGVAGCRQKPGVP